MSIYQWVSKKMSLSVFLLFDFHILEIEDIKCQMMYFKTYRELYIAAHASEVLRFKVLLTIIGLCHSLIFRDRASYILTI